MDPSRRSSPLARVGIALLVVGALVLLVVAIDPWSSGGSSETSPTVEPAPNATVGPSTDGLAPTPGVEPEGFTTITARITAADGEICEVCVWLADTSDERGRGLMGVTDLGGADGMVFRFDEPVSNSFFMLNTPTSLSIAWFAPAGDFVSATDMAPCIEIPEDGCPLYSPDGQYDLALEVFEGGLEPLGVGAGSRLELIEGTEAERCPVAP